jgi:hypothetical protein
MVMVVRIEYDVCNGGAGGCFLSAKSLVFNSSDT